MYSSPGYFPESYRKTKKWTVSNLSKPYLLRISTRCKTCTGKKQLDAVKAFPRKQEFCAFPPSFFLLQNVWAPTFYSKC